jgi:hypothetical protein
MNHRPSASHEIRPPSAAAGRRAAGGGLRLAALARRAGRPVRPCTRPRSATRASPRSTASTRTWARRPARRTSAPDEAVAKQIEAESLATVKWPRDGKYLGDWKEGEKLAQNGRGMTWTDSSAAPGQRRQLLQLPPDRQEGDLLRHHRPSLYNYGKLRGVTDPASPARPSCSTPGASCGTAKAYNACSNMPRFGHMGCSTRTRSAT